MDVVVIGGYAVIAVSIVLLVWAAVRAARDTAVILKQLIVAGVAEVAVIVQIVGAATLMATGREIVEPVVIWGYLILALLMFPGAAVVAIGERSRWSSVALIVIAFAMTVLELRIFSLWADVAATATAGSPT